VVKKERFETSYSIFKIVFMMERIPDSALAMYQTPNSLLENTSVKWLDYLFNREGVKANFKTEDKNPDIDGTFDILENSRFDGRLEVQIKTYNTKTSRNKPQYLCDTKVLFYALKNRLSCVLLFVVDHSNKKAYWKYLSKSFIDGLNLVDKQKKVTIKFNEDEYVDVSNFNHCLANWHSYFLVKNTGIYFEDCDIEESLKKRDQLLKLLENIDFSKLIKEDVVSIQKFIDRFNHLLDGDYNFIKRFYYPEMWKMGIAIGTFTSNSLAYVLYPIFWGSNDLIIKKINLDFMSFRDFPKFDHFLTASVIGSHNPIVDNSSDLILKHINQKIKDMIENKKFLFLSPEIAIEYIYDTLKDKFSSWKIDYNSNIDLINLKNLFENKYSSQIRKKSIPIYSRGNSDITTLYQCIEYLLNNDFKEINRLYALEPKEDGDYYNEYLYAKIKIVFPLLPNLFDAFMYYTFPSLSSKITFWNGSDLLSINLKVADDGKSGVEIHHFNRIDGKTATPFLIITKNFEHELYIEYKKEENINLSMFEIDYCYHGVYYKLHTTEFVYSNLKKSYSIHEELYKFIGQRFDDYLKPDCRIMWSDLGRRF